MADLIRGELNQVLTFVGLQIGADPQVLLGYAAEDSLGGYHMDATKATFPIGSLWGVEGQILYTLIRHLKPQLVVEIGGWAGASASHLALAVMNNGSGKVISVDSYIGDSLNTVGAAHGSLIPAALKPYVELINADGRVWLTAQAPGSIGLIFEDADHSPDLVMELSRLALSKLAAGGYLVNHDAGHVQAFYPNGNVTPSPVGQNVQDGLSRAGADFRAYLTAPSDCGLAITVAPGFAIPAPQFNPQAAMPPPVVQQPTPGMGFPQRDPYQEMFDKAIPATQEEFLKKRDFITGAPLPPIGNANIESQSPPPAPAPKPPVPKAKPVTKKKPTPKKTAPKA